MDTTVTLELGPVARSTGLPLDKVQRTFSLLEDGNTVPFITRYRKDQTGGLDEEQIRRIQEELTQQRLLIERKQTILKTIESQGKLTDELSREIRSATSMKRLEDLYLPYKPKKQTLATVARERGLEPLAREVLFADPAALDLDVRAKDFINEDKRVFSVADALLGVGHLIAEYFSERAELRTALRKIMMQSGKLVTSRATQPEQAPPKPAGSSMPGPIPSDMTHAPAPDSFGADVGPHAETESPAAAETVQAEAQAVAADLPPDDMPPPELVAENPTADPGENAPPTTAPEVTGEESAPPTEPPITDPPQAAAEETSVEGESAEVESAAEEGEESHEEASDGEESEESEEVADGEQSLDVTGFSEASADAKEKYAPSEVELKKVASTRKRKKKDAKALKRKQAEVAFKDYFEFKESLSKLPPHRVLAINRGERGNFLKARIDVDVEALVAEAEKLMVKDDHPHAPFLKGCLRDALTRLIIPSLERDIRRELTDKAETHATEVFAKNLRQLLLAPPVRGRRVLAVDPGYRSGCKVAALDEFGNVLGHGIIHLVGNEERKKQSRHRLVEMALVYHVTVIAIGNGTACREAEQLVGDILAEELKDRDIGYLVVNEAGASVYSTSPIGREELPHFDPILRSAVSIGRRTLDPLSELVKINPSNIGVGLYQHDVKAKHLSDSLDGVVESCVNFVGVDVNTASPSLLRYVSGLNQLTARRVYEYRTQHGPFHAREDLKKVPGVGDATYVQAAGFLKINGGGNPLDATWIHPESYEIAGRVLEKLGTNLGELAEKMTPKNTATAPAAAAPVAAPAPVVEAPAVEAPVAAPNEPASEVTLPLTEAVVPAPAAETSAPEAEAAAPAPAEVVPVPTVPAPAPEPVAEVKPEPNVAAQFREDLAKRAAIVDWAALATEWGVGELALKDIVYSLTRPGRDPREDLPAPAFRRGVVKLDNLEAGMELSGTVVNVVDFGAFVDIGLGDSGLVHISRLADRYISDPHDVVSVGDVLKVWVVSVDKERRRVSLTAIPPGTERGKSKRPERSAGGPRGPRPAGQRGGRPGGGRPQGAGQPAGAPSGASAEGATATATAGTTGTRPGGRPGGQRSGGQRPGGQGSGGPRPGGRPSGDRGGGDRGGGGRGGFGGKSRGERPSGPAKTYTSKPAPPKPVKPLTKAMKEGKAPLRSFGDLAQFVKLKDEPPPAPPQQETPPDAPPPDQPASS